MKLKKFSEYNDFEKHLTENEKVNNIDDIGDDVNLDDKTGKLENEDDDKEPTTNKNPENNLEDTPYEKENDEEEKVDENFKKINNVLFINNINIDDIYKLLSEKYNDIDYFIRQKDNDLHIVKYNENIQLNINSFVDSLFKFYSTRKNLKKLIENIKIKGNNKFSIIENINNNNIGKIIEDLSNLLSKK